MTELGSTSGDSDLDATGWGGVGRFLQKQVAAHQEHKKEWAEAKKANSQARRRRRERTSPTSRRPSPTPPLRQSKECSCRDGTKGETVDIKNVPSTAAVIAYKASKFNDADEGKKSIRNNLLSWYNKGELKGDTVLAQLATDPQTDLVSRMTAAEDKDQSNSETLFWHLKVPEVATRRNNITEQEHIMRLKAKELVWKAQTANEELEQFLAMSTNSTTDNSMTELGSTSGDSDLDERGLLESWFRKKKQSQSQSQSQPSPPVFEESEGISSCYAMASFQVFDFDGTESSIILGGDAAIIPPANVKLVVVKLALCKKSVLQEEALCAVQKAAVSCFYELFDDAKKTTRWIDCSEGDGEGALVAALMSRP